MEKLKVDRAVGGHRPNMEFSLECSVTTGRIVCSNGTTVSKACTN